MQFSLFLLNMDSIAQTTVYGVCAEGMSIVCGERVTKKKLKKPTLSGCA